MSDDIDIELFIGKVKSYPELWDISIEEFHDRQKKRNAWIEVCKEFYEGFEELKDKEKNEVCQRVIKKWRNIRDNYLRNVRKKLRSGQATDQGRRYVYARLLTFLHHSGTKTEPQSSLNAREEDDADQLEKEETQHPALQDWSVHRSLPYAGSNKKRRKSDPETSATNFTNRPVPTLAEPNADRSFFESLLPALRDLTEDQKIDFRCEVLNLVKKMRRTPQSSTQ